MMPEKHLRYPLLIVLPIVAFPVLRQRKLPEKPGDISFGRRMVIVYPTSLLVGAYDGFYGLGIPFDTQKNRVGSLRW